MSSYSPNSNKYLGMRVPSQNDNPNMTIYSHQSQFGYGSMSQLVQNQHQQQHELDPYAPAIVQDLLNGSNEWKNIQDIVKLTFKAVCDVMRSQGLAIRELERVMPTKANKSELNAGLSLKANVTDVSRTLAEVASSIETKLTFEEVQNLVDDKVSKTDLQYLLSNKISVEEMQKVLENKANMHEINIEMQSLNQKVEEIYRDLSKRMSNCALQKDFNYIQSILETKANIDDVNESLQNKANKQSVANALHRKANRSDIDQILETKADAVDLEKICNVLDTKADSQQLEQLIRQLEMKIDKQDYYQLRQEISTKSDKQDIDMYIMAVSNQKLEFEHRQKALEKDLDEFISGIQKELENMKSTMIQSLNKKADYTLLDSIKESLHKKVDHDYFQTVSNKIKTECQTMMTQYQNDISYNRKAKDDKVDERLGKTEMNSERALDEIFFVRDQFKQLQDERKKDIEETADFIKQIINTGKADQQKELQKMLQEVERVRRELIDKCSVNELLETKSKILTIIDNKIDLNEVQKALNDCQNDICEQLADFKKQVKSDVHIMESDILKMMERKANLLDVQEALSQKVDQRDLSGIPSKSDFHDLQFRVDRLQSEVQGKFDIRDFDEFDELLRKKIEELQNSLIQKSNIKDVCALLDMKSNIDDVNKAFTELNEDIHSKISQREFREALTEQNTINEALCAENCVGRWLWKSGELINGYAIPWEVQSVNTCPENFLWDEDKTLILTVAPGLYEITFGFYCNKKPTVQVLVNGEAILSAVNSSSYVIHHSSGKLKGTSKHSAGNLTGLTLVDFIALPARARISLSYSGEPGAEGFLGIRKL